MATLADYYIECIKQYLDELGVPKITKLGDEYSVWGRVSLLTYIQPKEEMILSCESCPLITCTKRVKYEGAAVPRNCPQRGEKGWPEKVREEVIEELRKQL